ncbi:MAG: gliding motility-associated C-terminal domain-containing protein [Chitinophagales bacterium]|nr:gliding motility-associated C-terminal domain-containing protein [Chitinophagales bacterium]
MALKKQLLITLLTLIAYSLNAQEKINSTTVFHRHIEAPHSSSFHHCGFDELKENLPEEKRLLQEQLDEELAAILRKNPDHFNQRSATYTVPVVVHIVHNNSFGNISDDRIYQSIEWLNQSFSNSGYYDQNSGAVVDIEFCLAKRDPSGNLTTGITRTISTLTSLDKDEQDQDLKDLIRWDPTCYVNIWVVREIIGGVAGYAYLPGAHGAPYDGIVCEAIYMGSTEGNNNVLTHEMGHYLGLHHTFNNGCANDDCMVDGDRVCDTPPDNSTAVVACNSSANTCSTDTDSGFATDQNDLIENYMDYGDLDCWHDFTEGQDDRMIFFLTGVRSSLLNCSSCLDPCPVDISAEANTNPLSVALGTNAVINLNTQFVTEYSWYVDGNMVSTSSTFDYYIGALGDFEVIVEVGNGDDNCAAYDTILIQPYCAAIAEIEPVQDTVTAIAGIAEMIDVNATNADTIQWILDGTVIGEGAQINYTFDEPGEYIILLEALTPFEDCNALNFMTVIVSCPPDVSVMLPEAYQIANLGETLEFTVEAMNTLGIEWSVDGVPLGTMDNFTYTFNDFGIYDIKVTGFADAAACNVTDNLQVEVECGQFLDVQASQEFIDVGESVDFSSVGFGMTSQEWYINGELVSTDLDFTYTFNDAGVYEVYLVGTFPTCEQRSESILITVHAPCFYDTIDNILEFEGVGGPINLVPSSVDDGQLLVFPEGVIKVDADNQIAWTRFFIGVTIMGASTDHINGGYFITYFGNPDFLTKVMRIDETGATDWETGQNYPFAFSYPSLSDIVTAPNGDALVYERIEVTAENVEYAYMARFTPAGQEIWSGEIRGFTIIDAHFNSNGDLLLSGYNQELGDALSVIKMDTDGNIIWSTTISPDDSNNFLQGTSYIEEYSDGSNLIIFNIGDAGGLYGSSHFIRISTDGEILAAGKLYDSSLPLAEQQVFEITKTLNGDFLISLATGGTGTSQVESVIIRLREDNTFRWARKNIIRGHIISFINHRAEGRIILFGGLGADNLLYQLDEDGFAGNCEMHTRIVRMADRSFSQVYDIYQTENLASWDDVPLNIPVQFDAERIVLCATEGINGIDLTINLMSASVCSDSITFEVEICNEGNLTAPADLPVTFYDGSPLLSDAAIIASPLLGQSIEPDSCFVATYTILNSFEHTPYLMSNDDGSATRPFNFVDDFPLTGEDECNFRNNLDSINIEALTIPTTAVFDLGLDTFLCQGESILLSAGTNYDVYEWQDGSTDSTFLATQPGLYILEANVECGIAIRDSIVLLEPVLPTLDLGADLSGCQNDVFSLQAQDGFINYLWQDGSTDNTFTAWEPGIYWVETIDYCGNVQRDSVEITLDPGFTIELGEPVYICPDDSVEVEVLSNYTSFQWFPGESTSCENCASTVLRPDTTTKYTLVAEGGGCFSSDTLSVIVYPSYEMSDTISLCFGDSVDVFGQVVDEAGVFQNTYSSFQGCDSVITIVVEVLDTLLTTEVLNICAGDSVSIFGNIVTTAGDYMQTFSAINGCDSTHIVSVMVQDTLLSESFISICDGDSISLFGQDISIAGDYEQTFTSLSGCDSTQVYHLSVLLHSFTDEVANICEGDAYSLWGQQLNSPGVYDSTFVAANGCDSIYTLTLEVSDTVMTSESRSICQGESTDIFGVPTTIEGEYSAVFSAANACDSTHFINLTVLDTSYTTESISLCQGETIDIFGEMVNEAGLYSQTFTNLIGCDSTHAVMVEVLDTMFVSETINLCSGDSIAVFGNTVTEAGTYESLFMAANGCDSTHQIILTFEDTVFTQEEQIICAGEMLDIFGEMIGESGSYTDYFASVSGCDSAHTINLIVLDTVASFDTYELCMGDSLLFNGEWISEAGIYTNTQMAFNGCDSTHYLEVNLLDTVQTIETITICEGDSTLIFGNYESEEGSYIGDFSALNGCDSTHVITLELNPVSSSMLLMEHCEGDSSLIFGTYQTAAGIYSETYTNQYGCDSISTIELDVLEAPQLTYTTESSCEGASDGSIEVIVNGGNPPYNYSWAHTSTDASQLNDLSAGTYNLDVYDSDGCIQSAAITIDEIGLPTFDLETLPESCTGFADGELIINSETETLMFSLNGENYVSSNIFSNLPAANYTVYIQSEEGCIISENIEIEAAIPLSLVLIPSLDLEQGTSVQLIPQGSLDMFNIYNWTPADDLSCSDCPSPFASPEETQLYTLTAETSEGCLTSADILVNVIIPEREIYLPNVFSPNGDGRNDVFKPFSGEDYIISMFRVFDRWGGLLYEEEGATLASVEGWDGTSQGLDVMPGVYLYVIEIEYEEGDTEVISGDVTLIR